MVSALASLAPRLPDWLRKAGAIAVHDVAGRYRRTVLGPLWFAMGTGMWIAAIYFVAAGLFDRRAEEFIPYLAVSITLWSMISGSLVASSQVYLRYATYVQAFTFPLQTYPAAMSASKAIILAHQAIAATVMCIYFGTIRLPDILLLLPALAVYFYVVFLTGVILGPLGARFRDVTPGIESVMPFLFLLTPIFWQKEILTRHEWIVTINPFHHFLEIGRAPVLGQPPSLLSWSVVLGVTAGLTLAAWLMHRAVRRKVIFWL